MNAPSFVYAGPNRRQDLLRRDAPKHADEVHLVAPFFEKDESSEAALDDHWARLLAQRHPDARFDVYLPPLEVEPLRVQGLREMFERLESELDHRLSIREEGQSARAI